MAHEGAPAVGRDPRPNTGGRYKVLDELGSGGMGAVFRAEDIASRRLVALKQLKSSSAGSKRRMKEALFEREYHTLVRLKHPRIIEVYDYGLTDDGPYYTMELLDGNDLQQLAPLPYREACQHLRDVASSLALLHTHRFVHRDISPRNVRLTADGRAKLIDFGALASFGTPAEIAGTPPSMAPEVLRRLPLDQRTDLFALGAIAYWALTGRHAYLARQVQDLPSVWRYVPPPPSQFAANIPPALDALIMSLLSLDPIGRPASAAAVIDQLTAIAALEPEAHEQAAESYLSSTKLVGRGEEHDWLQHRVLRALEGRGTEVLIEGPSGIGKTRLLYEIGIEAQLRGALALRADAQASSRAFGVALALAEQALDTLPEVARHALGDDAQLIASLSPDLAVKLGVEASTDLSDDPAERRARFQTALHAWFLALSDQHALLIAVDNIQTADDNSAAFLAALGQQAHTRRLMLIASQTSGDEIVAEVPLRAMRKRAARIKLAGLSPGACEELVCSLFGSVANTGRMAKVLYDKSAGNPQLCMDLATLLVKRKVAKYVDGAWVLPLEFAADELPSHVDDLLRAKLGGVSAGARRVCEALSIHDKRVAIENCVSLVQGMDEPAVYLALDELVAEHVLLVEDGQYGFRQQALRESVLKQIDAGRLRALHLEAADALLARATQGVGSRMEAAWHLLRAGEEMRGADLMAGATREFLRHQGVESVEQVVQGIDTALGLYEKHGRSKYEIASMLFPLMSLAFFVDWRVSLKHGERAIRLGLDITGLGLAQKLSRFLPDKLALGLGLLHAAVRFGVQRLRGVKFSLIEAIESFCGLVPAAVGTRNIVNDVPGTQLLCELIKPLKLFGKDHIASLMYDFADAQLLMCVGRQKEAREVLERLQHAFPDPRLKLAEVLGQAHYKAMYGGVLFSLGVLYPYEFGERALVIARELEELGVRVWAMAADEVRMLHHCMRGEAEAVQRYRERVELFAVQGSTTWQADIFWPILLLDSEIRAGDTISVRTIREQLTRRAKDHPTLQVFADLAHCSYLALRGEHSAAVAAFERLHERLRDVEPELYWLVFRASFAYATSLNALGEHERAKRYAQECLARGGSEVARVVAHYLEPQRQLALAEVGLGNLAEAARILDALLSAHAAEDQPLLIGLLHKARAQVAIAAGDQSAFALHFATMTKCFTAAGNPALVVQCDALAKQAERANVTTSAQARASLPAAQSTLSVSSMTQRALSDASTMTERAEVALRMVLKGSRASAGYLYMRRGERLELVAASSHREPSARFEAKLWTEICLTEQRELGAEEVTAAVDSNASRDEVRSVFIESDAVRRSIAPQSLSPDERPFRVLVLSTRRRSNVIVVVGGLIVELPDDCEFAVSAELLEPIASALLESIPTQIA